MLDPELLIRYQKILRMAREGATEGERTSAANAARKLEAKHPGIEVALREALKAAEREAKRDKVRRAGYDVPNLDPGTPGDSWFSRLAREAFGRVVEWSVEQLSKDISINPEDLEVHMRKSRNKKMTLEDELVSWAETTEPAIDVDPSWFEDVTDAEVAFSFEIPKALWLEILKKPETFIQFLNDAIESAVEDEEFEDEDEDEEEYDDEDDE